jgi:hypothetical protein
LNTAAKWQAALARADDVEYMRLLEAENTQLARAVEALKQEKREIEEQLRPKLLELPELYAERLTSIDLERKLLAVEAVRPDIEQLPEDLPAVLQLIERMYPDRILFCDAARESARTARLNEASGGIGIAWRLLRAMALVLHDIYMEGAVDIARSFRDQSGFDLALGEGASTRNDIELMRSRFVEHAGTVVDVGAHTKYGNREPRLLRVHYAFCAHCVRIVVGHCGDHLETAGTRRVK